MLNMYTNDLDFRFIKRNYVKVRINDSAKRVQFKEMFKLRDQLNGVKKHMDNMEGEELVHLKAILTHVHSHSGSKNKIEKKDNYNAENATNAWLKMWETIKDFNLFPNTSKKYKVFCNAELPGAFIFAINHWMKNHKIDYEWFGNSLLVERAGGLDNKKYLGDENHLVERYPKNWLMNDKFGEPLNDGDITKKSVRMDIFSRVGNKMDIYTSDLGFETELHNDQETVHFDAHVSAAICGVTSLAKGGIMILKSYTFFERKTISFWQSSIFPLFEECFIYKPSSSRMANSETYFVCRGLKKTISFDEGELLQDFDLDINVNEDIFLAAKIIYGNQIRKLNLVYKIMWNEKKGIPRPLRELVGFRQLGIKYLREEDKLNPNIPSSIVPHVKHAEPEYLKTSPDNLRNVYIPPHRRGGSAKWPY
jgi:hypothetical protein